MFFHHLNLFPRGKSLFVVNYYLIFCASRKGSDSLFSHKLESNVLNKVTVQCWPFEPSL